MLLLLYAVYITVPRNIPKYTQNTQKYTKNWYSIHEANKQKQNKKEQNSEKSGQFLKNRSSVSD